MSGSDACPMFHPSLRTEVRQQVALPSLRPVVAATFGGRVRAVLRQLGLVTVTAVAILAVCPGAYSLRGKEVGVLPTAALVTSLWIVVTAQSLGACGEELGWRCLLQPLLRGRSSVLVASAAVGLL